MCLICQIYYFFQVHVVLRDLVRKSIGETEVRKHEYIHISLCFWKMVLYICFLTNCSH